MLGLVKRLEVSADALSEARASTCFVETEEYATACHNLLQRGHIVTQRIRQNQQTVTFALLDEVLPVVASLAAQTGELYFGVSPDYDVEYLTNLVNRLWELDYNVPATCCEAAQVSWPPRLRTVSTGVASTWYGVGAGAAPKPWHW